MNNEIRKLLTEKVLGEKWHEWPHGEKWQYPFYIYCMDCGSQKSNAKANRTFRTPQDAQDLKDALVKAGKWDEFYLYAIGRFGECQGNYRQFYFGEDFTNWLFSYTRDSAGNRTSYRLCDLAGEWAKEGRDER